MTMAMELIRHIAGLYSGKAFKGDLTQIYITGNEIWMAQQILAEQAEGVQGSGNASRLRCWNFAFLSSVIATGRMSATTFGIFGAAGSCAPPWRNPPRSAPFAKTAGSWGIPIYAWLARNPPRCRTNPRFSSEWLSWSGLMWWRGL
ncbi:hypothetical protein [Pseudomonas citronellolis]|uniref:hypothetical protein n=1 Tax=Pseudomonas citronellolis TaxID=53408 RepID=UPI00142F3595|nr:hypothetical protein [Pseudomonas citronellolis]